MYYYLVLLISCNLIYVSTNVIKQPGEVIDSLMSEIAKEEDLEEIKNNLAKLFEEVYAFQEFSKNPIQPDFQKDYHLPVDMGKSIREVKTKDTSFYEFYQNIKMIIAKSRDGHTNFNMEKLCYLSRYIPLQPLDYSIRTDSDGKTKLYAKPFQSNETVKYNFRDGENVLKTIISNQNNYIEKINDQDPFEYISNLGTKYYNVRNPHGHFSLLFSLINRFNLFILPLSKEELLNFKVLYNGGGTFLTDYIIIDTSISLYGSNSISAIDINKIIEFNVKKNELFVSEPWNFNIKFDFKLKKFNYDNLKIEYSKSTNAEFSWSFQFGDIFKCGIDSKNELNVYYINSFHTSNNELENFTVTMANCALLFDENKYKTILILSRNGGGYIDLSYLLIQLFSPLTYPSFYQRIRITNSISKYTNYNLLNAKTGKIVPSSELIKNKVKVEYHEGNSDYLSAPFFQTTPQVIENVNKMRNSFKNKRKPTELIIFTDSYSFSAASLFTKYIQYYGGGITVGYFGIPNNEDIPFDSSLSPSPVLGTDGFKFLCPDIMEILNNKHKIDVQMAVMQTFYNLEDTKIPLEFTVTPVDHRFHFYETFSLQNYENFAKKANEIFEIYKDGCNPKNKKIVLVNQECDGKFENSYTHGGYECGDDSKWTTKCVPSYCDIGYKFLVEEKKCVKAFEEDTAGNNEGGNTNEPENNTWIYILIGVGSFIIVLAIVIIIIIFLRKRKKNDINFDKESPLTGELH